MTRTSGVLLHPTSLPGPYGIGEFSDAAYRFVDWLVAAGQRLWQVMPLGPTGYGDSPYQCFSAFAGNPLLIGLDILAREGALTPGDLADAPAFPDAKVDFGPVITWKKAILRKSYERFAATASAGQRREFGQFCADNAVWLDDYALFIALKNAHNGNVWNTWESDIARHEPAALRAWRARLADAIEAEQYYQFQFFRQWAALRAYANGRGVKIVGDIPIFVAFDSADAWSHRDEFHFDEALQPTVIAGVPPDYFSPTGQRWGNPLYRWEIMRQRGYGWWIERCKAAFGLYDILRIDHFRGFESYWEVPASEPTAMRGRWVESPGLELFQAIERALGALPIIAEDLGVITPEVEALRDACGFPGMRVMQFAFVADTASAFLPHNYIPNTVAYVGTHDNDTTLGWWAGLDAATRAQVTRYTGTDGSDIAWDLIRTLMVSVADTVVFTMQDLMGLGADARMNLPGRAGGNWGWRFTPEMLSDAIAQRLKLQTETYGRAG
jgi:4-alpha-glucanotransferase